ncbi:MAG: TolC family protein [Alphaproteobacteria bacterium]|nr:TolC family protein [Alphaproteobacteria bacterium]
MIAVLLAALVWAAPPAPTLAEVLASVDAHLPLLAAAEAKVRAAEAEQLGSAGIFDPAMEVSAGVRQGPYDGFSLDAQIRQATPLYGLRLEAGYRLGTGRFPVYDGKLDTLDQGEVGGALVLPLLKDGLTDPARTALAVARAEVEGAEADLAAKRLDLRRKARHAWWGWLAASEKRAVADDMLRVALAAEEAVTARIARGDAAAIEAVDALRVVRERQASLAQAVRDQEVSALVLGLYLRDGSGRPAAPVAAADGLPRPTEPGLEDAADALDRALRQRPELRGLEARLAAAEAHLRLAKVGVLPKLDLGVGLYQDLAAPGENAEPLDVRAGGKLAFTFLQRPGRGKLGSARAKVEGVEAERTWLRDTLAAEVGSARASVQAAHARALLAEEVAALAAQLEEATVRRLELGDADRFALYLREQSTLKARLDAIDAWTAFHRAQADLRAATGEP